jgi:hypothetical protein
MTRLFARISRGRSLPVRKPCLHEFLNRKASDEQRERRMRSITSLLMLSLHFGNENVI